MPDKHKKKKHTYLVIGLGRFGSALCDGLVSHGASVIAVDSDMAKVEAFSDRVEYIACLDATNELSLEKIGAKDADIAIVCLGFDQKATIMTSAILIDLGIPRVIACASDTIQARILSKIGVHHVIRPQEAMGRRTADMLVRPWLRGFADLGDDMHIAGRIKAPEKLIGKSLKELALPAKYGVTIMTIERGGQRMIPSADFVIEEGDKFLVFGDKKRMNEVLSHVVLDDDASAFDL